MAIKTDNQRRAMFAKMHKTKTATHPQMLQWKSVGNKQWEAENKKEKLDFVIDARTQPVAGIVFDSKIRDGSEAHREDLQYDSVTEAKKDLSKYKR